MAYNGLIATFPVGQLGLTGKDSLITQLPSELIAADSITFENGVVEKEGGADHYNSTAIASTPIVVGGDYWDNRDSGFSEQLHAVVDIASPSEQRIVVDADYNGSFEFNAQTNLTEGGFPVFVQGGDETAARDALLFFFNGLDEPQVKTGAVTSFALFTAGNPADWGANNWPTFGVMHNGRHFAGGNGNDANRLYYTESTNHADFTTAGSGSLSIFPGEGIGLTGAVTFKGLLIAFKEQAVYLIDTRDPTVANWTVNRLTSATGMLSPLAAVVIGDDDAVVWLDNHGIFRIARAADEFGNMRGNRLLAGQNFDAYIRKNIELSRLNRVQAVYYAHKDQAHFVVTNSGDSVNNRRIIIDFNGEVPKAEITSRDTCESLWMRKHTDGIYRPVIGDNAGRAWDIDTSTYNKNSVTYTSTVQIPHSNMAFLDPQIAHREKNGQFLEAVMEPGESVSAEIFWDETSSETVTLNANQKQRIRGSGKFFGAKVTHNTINTNFHLAALRLYFTLGGERP